MSDSTAMGKWLVVQMPITDYTEALNLQKDIVAAKADGIIADDVLLCLEHPRVFTVGRRGGRGNLMVDERFLEREGVAVIDVERGGDITYHGPGQLVLYPIVHLEKAKIGIGEFITVLEDVMLHAASTLGVSAERNSLNRGIWIGNAKLGNIGICVRRGIAFHGLSLNVNVALEPFGWINPCGLQGITVTSIKRELSRGISMEHAREAAKRGVEKAFGVELLEISVAQLRCRIEEKSHAVARQCNVRRQASR